MTFAVGVIAKTEPIPHIETVEASIANLKRSIEREMPDLKRLQIVHEPSNPSVPLVIVAYRI